MPGRWADELTPLAKRLLLPTRAQKFETQKQIQERVEARVLAEAQAEAAARKKIAEKLALEARRKRRRAKEKQSLKHKKKGLPEFWYETVAAEQGWVCAICGKPPPTGKRLFIDHDHVTGAVWGLLCSACNSGIGHLREDPAIFKAALEYLAKYKQG